MVPRNAAPSRINPKNPWEWANAPPASASARPRIFSQEAGRFGQVARMTEMGIVISVAPTSKLSLETELRLIKPALLYGDRVTLYSPATSLVAMAAAIGELSEGERVDFLAQVIPAVSPDSSHETLLILNTYRELRRTRRRSREQILLVERVRSQLDAAWDMIRDRMEQMVTASGANELVPAMEAGLLDVDVLLKGEADFSPDRLLQEFLDRLAQSLTGDVAYPLFDDKAGSLVGSHVAEGLIVPTQSADARGRQVAAAAALMSRLPAFPGATVSEVLDIREELQDPLVRFRAAMVAVTRSLATRSYDVAFAGEVEQTYVDKVGPALLEISEAIQANRYLRQLLGQATTDMKTILTGVLTFGLTRTSDMAPLIAGGAAATTAAVTAAWNAAAERRRIRQHWFYLLYETQRLLASD